MLILKLCLNLSFSSRIHIHLFLAMLLCLLCSFTLLFPPAFKSPFQDHFNIFNSCCLFPCCCRRLFVQLIKDKQDKEYQAFNPLAAAAAAQQSRHEQTEVMRRIPIDEFGSSGSDNSDSGDDDEQTWPADTQRCSMDQKCRPSVPASKPLTPPPPAEADSMSSTKAIQSEDVPAVEQVVLAAAVPKTSLCRPTAPSKALTGQRRNGLMSYLEFERAWRACQGETDALYTCLLVGKARRGEGGRWTLED